MKYLCRYNLRFPVIVRLIIILLGGFSCGVSHSYDGTVNVSGQITANTCTVSVPDMTVDMGKVDVAAFAKGRDASGLPATPFAITLKGCNGASPGVAVGFYGKPDTNLPDIYALAGGGAKGIGIKLMDKDRIEIPANTMSKQYPLDANATEVALQFYALYTADGADVVAGRADATVAFHLIYE